MVAVIFIGSSPSLPSLPLVPRSYRGDDHQSTYRYADEDEKRDRPKYLEHTKTDQSPGQNEKHRTILLGKPDDITTSAQAALALPPEAPISAGRLAHAACAQHPQPLTPRLGAISTKR
jgi:hypothetical protein